MSGILDYYHLEKKSLRHQRPYNRARLWQVGLALLLGWATLGLLWYWHNGAKFF